MPSAWLFLLTIGPERPAQLWEALDMLLAFSAFEQPVAALFDGDAVGNLVATVDAANGDRTTAGVIASFPLYEIKWFACASSASERHLLPQRLLAGTSMLSSREKHELMAGAREILVF